MAESSSSVTPATPTMYTEYSLDTAIKDFFERTAVTHEACNDRARSLTGGRDAVVPVDVQGACSYTVYAGPNLEYVVQFRLESLLLDPKLASLVASVYGSLAPDVSFEGIIGEGGRGPLYVYLMNRMRGITHLDFILANGFPENSADNIVWRKNLMGDIARFLALCWKAPPSVPPEHREKLHQTYSKDLRLLYSELPSRFQPIVQMCIDSLDDILSLPFVILHRDVNSSNILVDEKNCHLVGVIDWAEAEVHPFGLNLHSLQSFTGKLHLKHGWTRYEDYDALQDVFWQRLEAEVGGLSKDVIRTIETARILGLLLSGGFTSRLADKPEPVPIRDDEQGRYNIVTF